MNIINKALFTTFLCGAVGSIVTVITFAMFEKKLHKSLRNIDSHLDRINDNLEDCLSNINDHLWDIKGHIKNFENKKCTEDEDV